jgi:transposase-like protein
MSRQDLERQRRAKHRLAVIRHAQETGGNVSATCRYYGISRHCHDKWLRRYDGEGLDGLRDRSSAPHHRPTATTAEVVGKIPGRPGGTTSVPTGS